MKTLFRLLLGVMVLLAGTPASRALNAVGRVFCDANQNSQFDFSDPAIPGVFVVVTNLSGTFSNGNWTTTPDGRYVVALPNAPDTYAAFILPATLAPVSSVVIPSSGVAFFSISNQFSDFSTNFLVNSSVCRTNSFQAVGQVFCDINFNGVIDPIDRPLGVLVGITNLSGTFSNAVFSTNGTFVLNLPPVTDTYVEFLIPSSLPPGFVIELPTNGTFSFIFSAGIRTNYFSRFLIDSPFCREIGGLNETTGRVLCDANANGMIDSDDSPLAGVMVVVTNSTGTFSNAVFTSASGTFVMALPAGPGTYTEFLNPATLPPLSTNLIPSSGVRFFILGETRTTNVGDFLISNPGCLTNVFEVTGLVFCDVNTNGFIDPTDAPLAGVTVVVTNRSGTFSNAVQTDLNGFFAMPLPHVSDIYDEFLLASSLPPNSIVVTPPTGVFCFVIGNGQSTSFGQFLVQSPACQNLGTTNSWTKPTSGAWEEPFWSLGILPNSSQTIEITNAGFKSVAIGGTTVSNFSNSLIIRHLDLFAPTGSFNTLLLNYTGTATPLRVLNGADIGTNGRILNLFSGLLVDTGGLVINHGEVAQQGGFTQVGDFIDVEGRYALTNGLVQAPLETIGNGSVESRFVENGGTNATGELVLRGGPPLVRYDLLSGLLTAGSEKIFNGVRGTTTIAQAGGQNIVTNQLRLEGSAIDRDPFGPGIAQYILTGGTLSAGSMLLGAYSSYAQSNGFATVLGAIDFNAVSPFFRTTSFLAGGTLATANLLFSGAGENLVQTAGTLIVTNLFSFGGFSFSPPLGFALYDFAGGTLTASNIEILANMSIGTALGQTRRITNYGIFKLGGEGTITTATIDERLGRFILAGSATVDMSAGASKLAFANSSGQTWTSGAVVSIVNWNGSTNGGGSDQLFFGTTATGLTASQLRQIRFVNPAGFAPGTYPAKILSTGEVVPADLPILDFTRSSNALVLKWQGSAVLQTATNVLGPYLDLPTATSPTTNIIGSDLQRFFRLRR